MNRSDPPLDTEFELSVIGPGRGECIVVHLGYNDWCVIDSCIAAGESQSAAVEYLKAFGQSALQGVRLVIATHWHDDHIRGLASALRNFPNAAFSCSAAQRVGQFLELIELATDSIQADSGLDEYREIFDILTERRGAFQGRNLITPQWAIENRELLRLSLRGKETDQARIVALSPSDATIKESFRFIGQLMPKQGEPQQRIADIEQNSTSVVLLVTAGSRVALLGADLVHSVRSEVGWFAVLSAFGDGAIADYFKVPHHGSANADCPEVWQNLLRANPVAVVTPYGSGKGLPGPLDLKRLLARTSELYCTSRVKKKPPRRDATVEKLLKNVERVVIEGPAGHVRIRSSIYGSDQPRVELFNGAFKVAEDDARIEM